VFAISVDFLRVARGFATLMAISAKERRSLGRMSRRAAWILIALCAWTLYVWISRIVIMSGQDESTGFKVVHGVLALISIAFGLAAGWIGYRRLRKGSDPVG
jgi:hypothetical protein